jgi:hypothetical protein
MPEITDTPPARVQTDLQSLRQALTGEIPAKVAAQNLLIATWNIRSYRSLTKSGRQAPSIARSETSEACWSSRRSLGDSTWWQRKN